MLDYVSVLTDIWCLHVTFVQRIKVAQTPEHFHKFQGFFMKEVNRGVPWVLGEVWNWGYV